MTPEERADQAAVDLIRAYLQFDVVAMLVRTRGSDVSIICPDADKPFMVRMLRAAASSLEEPASKRIN